MEKYVYLLTFENYKGRYFFELYHKKENALNRFKGLKNAAQLNEEVEELDYEYNDELEDGELSFFDPDYDECSTYIYFQRINIDKLFED